MKTYIMVWEEESETWYYFIDSFNENDFPEGYGDYYIVVENDKIIDDTYNKTNIGKSFKSVYNSNLWKEKLSRN